MKNRVRYLEDQVHKDLEEKMVFIGGPRQVGKTTLAKRLLAGNTASYYNWDIPADRERILEREWPSSTRWVLDEIHKYRQWRNLLKGLYDQFHETVQILVTGSARLDLYRRGGDSLQGRYHYLRLHPLSVAELGIKTQKNFMDLLILGGFPEPFFRGDVTGAKRWSREYRSRLLEEDLRSLEHVQDIGTFELLLLRLPALVGSPLSLNALREDLHVSHKTVGRWLLILERLYGIFRLAPLGAPQIRAVKKEQKHYHLDWSIVPDEAMRFENLVACHLLKWVHWQQDTQAEDIELRYMRDREGREVDFVLCTNGQPTLAVECKWNDAPIDRNLVYFKKHFPDVDTWQISAQGSKDYVSATGIRVAPAWTLLEQLI